MPSRQSGSQHYSGTLRVNCNRPRLLQGSLGAFGPEVSPGVSPRGSPKTGVSPGVSHGVSPNKPRGPCEASWCLAAKFDSLLSRGNFWLAITLAQIASYNASQIASPPQETLKTQTSIFNIWRFFPQNILRVQILKIFWGSSKFLERKNFEDFQKYWGFWGWIFSFIQDLSLKERLRIFRAYSRFHIHVGPKQP